MSSNAIAKPTLEDLALQRAVRILTAILLLLILAFFFLASSICITLILASFLAILADPAVNALERRRVPRSLAGGIVVLSGAALVAVFLYISYLQLSALSDNFPVYADRLHHLMAPLDQKIQRVQESAGAMVHDAAPNQAPELRIRESTPWSTYLLRGVGSAGGAFVIAGIAPFLVFFMLLVREKLYICFKAMLGNRLDLDTMIVRLRAMVRGYVIGNLWIGAAMAVISVLIFWKIGLKPAITLGVASGLLNLIPFVGVLLALAVPLIAGLVQFHGAAQFLIVIGVVLTLHLLSANFLIPHFVGSRLEVGPVAATIGLMFWGWLWGIPGILLAVPLTAVLKILADSEPSMAHLSNLLARNPHRLFRKRNAQGKEVITASSGSSR
jgi:predicted PurR-regulated permease PerM